MLEHIRITVASLVRSKASYTQTLAPLAMTVSKEISAAQTGSNSHAGFGKDGNTFFWIGDGGRPTGAVYIAFAERRLPPAARTTERRDRDRTITRTTTARLSSIRTATIWI